MNLPVLGLGTAPILGRVSRAQGLRCLEYAYELGIRVFDTARSYGWGEAEAVVGEFLKARPRQEITLVGKCGIVPAPRSSGLATAKALARMAFAIAPPLRPLVRRAAASSYQPTHTYDVAMLKESVEMSLRELRTEYFDVLLLHNFGQGLEGLAQVTAWLRDTTQSGKSRRFGFSIEGSLIGGLHFLKESNCLQDAVIQAPVTSELMMLPQEFRSVPIIAHSPFRYLTKQSGSAEPDAAALSSLLRQIASCCNCIAMVCSMFTEKHIDENVRAWKEA